MPCSSAPSLALPADDAVYLQEEDERREYVLSQQGLIYMGSRDYITSTPWNFGQVSAARPWDTQHHTANKTSLLSCLLNLGAHGELRAARF